MLKKILDVKICEFTFKLKNVVPEYHRRSLNEIFNNLTIVKY